MKKTRRGTVARARAPKILILVAHSALVRGLVHAEAALAHGYDVIVGSTLLAVDAAAFLKPAAVVAGDEVTGEGMGLIRRLKSSSASDVPIVMITSEASFAVEASIGIAQGWWRGIYRAPPEAESWVHIVEGLIARPPGTNRPSMVAS